MKKTSLTLINVIILVVGVLFIAAFRREGFIHTLIFVTGVMFIIPGIFNLFTLAKERPRSAENPEGRGRASRVMSWMGCIAALILGASMCIVPETYGPALIYIFALVLISGGVYHLYMIARGLRGLKLPRWTYALPTLIALGGVAILVVKPLRDDSSNATVLVTGIAFILFAITSFIEMICVKAANRNSAASSHQIEDVKAEDVN